MTKPIQLLPSILRSLPRAVSALAIFCLVPMLAAGPAQAQTYSVIHAFTGGGDGASPAAGLTLNGGILYGTAAGGGGVIGRNCDPGPRAAESYTR